MSNRISLLSTLVVVLPIVVVLVVVLVLAHPSTSAPATSAGKPSVAATGSTSASAARPAANSPTTRPVDPTARPAPRPSSPTAPDFEGGGAWINSAPLKLADLKGKVVLVDFWTYGCYNCTNTLPYIKQWWDRYKDQGLVIVGVHTPEFESEKLLENVQQAVQREGIGWPVVQDNDKRIWRAYGNHYWPHFYLIDDRGQIIYDHIGEGAYDETERQIAAALATARAE